MFYPEDVIEQVRLSSDIVDVISGYVNLKKKGSTYFGLCPFHNEKTPSFSVSPDKQMYYCFGCAAGGNVITFIMEYENYTFLEALKLLAQRAGITLPLEEQSQAARQLSDLKTQLLQINKLAAKYFYRLLKTDQGKTAYSYLREKRGLTDETITKFGLGYASQYRDDLYQYLKKSGYKDSLLKESGLVKIEEKGANDKFWNRVIFPIMDVNNRVIGFGGRVMGEGMPKYLNSPETKLFDKSRNLYGLNNARLSKKPYVLLCEGYLDVIAMYQGGFTNAVASLGTAFTVSHASLLKRYTSMVILAYDSDQAGIKAALRAIPILKNAGISAKVLNLSPYKDPDEFIKALGSEAFQERIEDAQNSFLFEIDILYKQYDMADPEQKTNFYNETAKKLLAFPEELERNVYIEAISAKFAIPMDSLKKLVNRMGGEIGLVKSLSDDAVLPSDRNTKKKTVKEKNAGMKQSYRLMITWLINQPQLFKKIKGILSPEDFLLPLYINVAKMVWADLEEGEVSPASIINTFINDEEDYKEVASIFNTVLPDYLTKEEREKALNETVIRIKRQYLSQLVRSTTELSDLEKIKNLQLGLDNLHISLS